MSWFSGIGKFFGVSPKGSQMNAADSATEDTVQAALDKLVTGNKAFGNRTMSAADAENQLRAQGVLPQGWRLRESDSTSSGYRPTQAASKKMAALHAAEVGAAGFGGAAALGIGAGVGGLTGGSSLLTNAAIQGGLGAAQGGATGGWKGALLGGGLGAAGAGIAPGGAGTTGLLKNMAVQGGLGAVRGAATGGGVKGALLGGGFGAAGAAGGRLAPAVTANPLARQAINLGVNTGLSTARTGQFSPIGTALGAAQTIRPPGMANNPVWDAFNKGAGIYKQYLG
jgi:hypothetical protein